MKNLIKTSQTRSYVNSIVSLASVFTLAITLLLTTQTHATKTNIPKLNLENINQPPSIQIRELAQAFAEQDLSGQSTTLPAIPSPKHFEQAREAIRQEQEAEEQQLHAPRGYHQEGSLPRL